MEDMLLLVGHIFLSYFILVTSKDVNEYDNVYNPVYLYDDYRQTV